MRKRLASFWDNYKFRFVPWIIYNLKRKQNVPELKHKRKIVTSIASDAVDVRNSDEAHNHNQASPSAVHQMRHDGLGKSDFSSVSSSMILHHTEKGKDKLITDDNLLRLLVLLFERFSRKDTWKSTCKVDDSRRSQEIMHELFGYSIERRKSTVSEDAGTGVFLASGTAKPGSLIGLYPGSIYMPTEPLFFPSIGNPFIFRCTDGIHIDGNDKWISRSIFKSCAARDKFRIDLPCCDQSWLTSTPVNPLNIGQYVNNRSKSAVNNVVYEEASLKIAMSITYSKSDEFPVHLCKYLPNVWANPNNNFHPLRLVPLVAVKTIKEGDEILSSYFTLVHSKENEGDK